MTATDAAEAVAPPGGIGIFEKWLSVWVALAIGAGLLLGNLVPGSSRCWRAGKSPRSTSRSPC
jgi:hypothetical protein